MNVTASMPARCAALDNATERCMERDRLASAVASAVERNDMLSALLDQQAAFRRVAMLVAGGHSPSEVFAAVADEMARCLHVCHANLLRYELDRSGTVAASYGAPDLALSVGERLILEGENVASRVFRVGGAVRMDSHENALGSASARIRELGLHAG